ncbi:MAG: hypothetical protein Q8K70_01820 [Bacteroidota bacterium]|nr:hypothetical protein [Bacteroidota bacterium]
MDINLNINSKGDNNKIVVNLKNDFGYLKDRVHLIDCLEHEIETMDNNQDKKMLILALKIILKNHTEEIELKYGHINPNETINPVTDINKKDNN